MTEDLRMNESTLIFNSTTIHPIIDRLHTLNINETRADNEHTNENDNSNDRDYTHLTSILESLHLFVMHDSQVQLNDKINIFKSIFQLSSDELNVIVKSAEFNSWSDDTVADLCIEIDKSEIPHSNAVLLLQATVYTKVKATHGSISRVLMNSIMLLGKTKGKLLLDGFIVPILFRLDLVRPILDMLLRLITQSLPANARSILLHTILSDGRAYLNIHIPDVISDEMHSLLPWNDAIFQVIGAIISTQPYLTLTKETLFDIIGTIQNVVQSDPKDKASMQLLLILTNKYPHIIAEYDAIDFIGEITQQSQMFLKRAIVGHLSNIRKKYEVINTALNDQ